MRLRTCPTALLSLLLPSAVAAQADCDSLYITSIHYSAFEDSIVEVRVMNAGSGFFSYPSLVLYDNNGDTLAWQYWTFFGIGPDQTFHLPVVAGANVPQGFFDATVEVWTQMNSVLACSQFVPYTNLCPIAPCTEVYPWVINGSAGLQFDWTVTDSMGTSVATGSMVIPAGASQVRDTVCLPPGAYSLGMVNSLGIGESIYFNMAGSVWNAPVSPQVEVESGLLSSFILYEACIENANAIPENASGEMEVSIMNGILSVRASDGVRLDEVEVLDALGRLVGRTSGRGAALLLNIADMAPGVLTVRAMNANGGYGCRSIVWVP